MVRRRPLLDQPRLRPAANEHTSAKTKIVATATQRLREFSLDFQDVLEVSSVKVGGRSADFSQVEPTPDLSDAPVVTQPMKLVVEPHPSTRPKRGRGSPSRSPTAARRGDHRPRHLDRGLDPRLLSARPAADLRRSVRGQRADGRPELVSVEQLSDRQGDLRHLDPGAGVEDRARRRRARRRTEHGDGTATWH